MKEVQCIIKRHHAPVLSLGHKNDREEIVVDYVLCMNMPDMTEQELGELSWKCQQAAERAMIASRSWIRKEAN